MNHLKYYVIIAVAVIQAELSACDRSSSPVGSETLRRPLGDFLQSEVVVHYDSTSISPLSATATFATRMPVQITIRVLGDRPISNQFSSIATEHVIPILGLYPNAANQVELRLTNAKGQYGVDTLTIRTVGLPAHMPAINVKKTIFSQMEPGLTLSNMILMEDGNLRSQPFMFDRNGAVRWLLDLTGFGGPAYLVQRFSDGHLWFAIGSTIYSMNMKGTIQQRIEVAGYKFHHDLIELPNGRLVGAVSKESAETINDHIIEVNPASGRITRVWDLRQILDIDRHDHHGNATNWLHMNGIAYDPSDTTLVVSGRHQGMVKITMDNELVWILAPHRGWGRAGTNEEGINTADYLLTTVDKKGVPYSKEVQDGRTNAADFGWGWAPHAPVVLPNGNLFLFDNGDQRNFVGTPLFSRGVEYAIDEASRSVRQIWAYGEDRGVAYYSRIVSNVERLPETGNRLIAPGFANEQSPSRAFVTEVNYPSKENIFEAVLSFEHSQGLQLIYRSDRMGLYGNL